MRYRKLGNTDLDVSSVCLGTMTWGHQNTEKEAHKQLNYALDQDINFIDTAEMYAVPPQASTQGLTEKYLGTWLKQYGQRDKLILATKMTGPGLSWIRDGKGLVAGDVEAAVNGSLERLQTDVIDLYQLHWPQRAANTFGSRDYKNTHLEQDRNEQMLEMLQALKKQIDAGKIRHIGVSNETPWGLMKYLSLYQDDTNLPRIQSVQNPYSLLQREFDNHTSEVCVQENISMLSYSSLAGGILSGKYLNGSAIESSRFNDWGADRQSGIARLKNEEITKQYAEVAQKHNLDFTQMSLSFALDRFFMTSVIIGATTMEQLKTCIDADNVRLSDDVLNDIDALHQKNPNPALLA